MIASHCVEQEVWLSHDWAKRLQYILHLGLVEIRNLAMGGNAQQIHDLADALEILPQFINSCDRDQYELIMYVLTNYQETYHSNFDYPSRLKQIEAPQSY